MLPAPGTAWVLNVSGPLSGGAGVQDLPGETRSVWASERREEKREGERKRE